MMSKPLDLSNTLGLDRFPNLGKSWIISTAEHEILPDEYPKLIACVIKDVFLPDTTAPYSRSSQPFPLTVLAWLVQTVS